MVNENASVMAFPGRLDYFPPISSPATMFQRRKKKSAREVYQLSPEDPEVLGNPPTTPWAWDDSAADFFQALIATQGAGGGDVANANGATNLKSTWPFLRQIGPKCVFRGMRKKHSGEDPQQGGGVGHHTSSSVKYECKNSGKSHFNERFIEPKCVGISPELAIRRHHLQYISPHLDRQEDVRRQVSSSHFKDASAARNTPGRPETLSPRGIQAPPPSGRRSRKTDDVFLTESTERHHQVRAPPGVVTKSSLHSYGPFYNAHHIAESARRRALMRRAEDERVVRFEQSPLPEKLRHLTSASVMGSNQHSSVNMERVTWQDIVQTPVVRLGVFVDGDDAHTLRSASRPVDGESSSSSKADTHISFRLPKPKSTSSTSGDSDATASQGRDIQRSRTKGNDHELMMAWNNDGCIPHSQDNYS